MKKTLFTLCAIAVTFQSFSQLQPGYPKNWKQSISGQQHDEGHDIIRTSEGSFVVVGETWSKDIYPELQGKNDAVITKLNPAGEVIWSYTYGSPDEDVAYSICETSAGDFIVSGMSECNGMNDCGNSNTQFVWVFCINAQGQTLWSNITDFIGKGQKLAMKTDGGFYLCVTGAFDFGIAEYDNNGSLLDYTNFHEDYLTRLHDFTIDAANNLYIYGSTYRNNDTQIINDPWLSKVKQDGSIEWKKNVGNKGVNLCSDLVILPENTIALAISSEKAGDFGCGHEFEFTLSQFDLQGEHKGYDLCFSESEIQQPKAVFISNDKSIWMISELIQSMSTESTTYIDRKVVIRQADMFGEILDIKYHNSSNQECGIALYASNEQVIVLTNERIPTAHGYQFDNKITSYKVTQHPEDYNGPVMNAEPLPIIKVGEEPYFIDIFGSNDDTENTNKNDESPDEQAAIAVDIFDVKLFPNPTQSMVTLTSNQVIKRIRVFNSQGMEVIDMRRVEQEKVELDVNNLPAGIYFTEIKSEEGWIHRSFVKN
jgi:Secretion system C-terminal sorting domain